MTDYLDADSWLDLREGQRGTMRGKLDNVSPASTADCIVIVFPDWTQMALDVPEGRPVECKHLEGMTVTCAVRRTEDGCECIAIWEEHGVPIVFWDADAPQLTTVS